MPYRLRARVKRDGEKGQYSTGGHAPKWVDIKKAKVWKRAGDLSLHLTQLPPAVLQDYIDRWVEVLEFEVIERRTGDSDRDYTVQEWIQAVDQNRKARETKRKQQRSSYEALKRQQQEEAELAELKRLQAKYPNIK